MIREEWEERNDPDVIKDLLPLYLEGMASGGSRKLVEDHQRQPRLPSGAGGAEENAAR